MLRDDYHQRINSVGGTVRLNQIVEALFHTPYLRVADLPARLNVTYPTAQADIDRLVQAGILSRLENVGHKTFYAPEVFEIVFADVAG
jgi:Fic family protein